MSSSTLESTTRNLEERFGGVYELGALAQFCGVSSKALQRALTEAGVPLLTIGRKRAVVRELADRVLGLDRAEVALEIRRNEEAMRTMELRPDGSRKTAAEFAAEVGAVVNEALGARRTQNAG